MQKQSKWKSPVLWISLASQVASILVLTGTIDTNQSDTINLVVGLGLQILTAVGVLNNPDNADKF